MTQNAWSYLLSASVLLATAGCNSVEETSPSAAIPVSHKAWNMLLNQCVNEAGGVDYEKFLGKEANLDEYLLLLKGAHPNPTWSKTERMAFWINAYNAYTVKLVLSSWPINSVKDVSGPWDIPLVELEGRTYSLKTIENDFLRSMYKDPRIHFALVCASESCPNLRNEAYTGEYLEQQLDDESSKFINDSRKNKIEEDEVVLSRIFKWYRSDFKDSGGLLSFINRYSRIKVNLSASIEFQQYDWSLNRAENL